MALLSVFILALITISYAVSCVANPVTRARNISLILDIAFSQKQPLLNLDCPDLEAKPLAASSNSRHYGAARSRSVIR